MIDALPPLREVIAKHDLRAQKSLGQNFLLDLNLTDKIARSAGDLTNYDVMEIGPGPGGLTRAVLKNGARRVLAVEKDHRCIPPLKEISQEYPGRLTIVHGDALDINPLDYLKPPIKIIANLPYNVGTALLIKWLTPTTWPPIWHSMTLMFQKEVADRITAKPNTKAYGRLSLLCNWRTTPKQVMTLPAAAFTPPPKVSSAVVHFEALEQPRHPASQPVLDKLIAQAFQQRRKMLRSSLKTLTPAIEDHLVTVGIAPTDRAENVTLEQFCALARELE